MDTHIADAKLKELHIEEATVKANDRNISQYEIDPEAEKKLLRKLDLRVVPMLWFLYMLSFLDRTNIGMFAPISAPWSESPLTAWRFRQREDPRHDRRPRYERQRL